LPYIYPIKRISDGKVRYIPHHKNRIGLAEKLGILKADDFVDVLIKRGHALSNVEKIVNSRFVLTNSLHTAIIAQAYGTPWAASLLEGEEFNMPMKWKDVTEFLGICQDFETVKDFDQGYQWWNDVGVKAHVPSLIPLAESFPYHMNSIRSKVIAKLREAS